MADIQKFLDQGGVSTLWSRIAEELNKKAVAADTYTKSEVDVKVAAATYDDTALASRVSANETAIGVLNGDSTVAGSVAYQIAQIVAGADESLDTLKEIADWISTHGSTAAEMQTDISENAAAIVALKALVGDNAVADQIASAIDTALKVDGADKYALATDLASAVARITTNESDIASLKTLTAGHTTDISNLSGRIDGIVAGGGEPNTINSIKVNGVTQTITDKAVDISVPVVAALTTDEIDAAIASAQV